MAVANGDDEQWGLADDALGPGETVAQWQLLAPVQQAPEQLNARCRWLLQAVVGVGGEAAAYGDIAQRPGMPVGMHPPDPGALSGPTAAIGR